MTFSRRKAAFVLPATAILVTLAGCRTPSPDGIGYTPDQTRFTFKEGGALGPDWMTSIAMKSNVSAMGGAEMFDQSQRSRDRREKVGPGH